MSDLGDTFRAWKEEKKSKKKSNVTNAYRILDSKGIEYQILSPNGPHLRIGNYDFWAGTGLFVCRTGKDRGRGIKNLLRRLDK